MSGEKWEAKNRAAQQAEAKFAANQARAAKQKPKKHKSELDEVGEALGTIDTKVGPLGWLIAHKKVAIGVGLVLVAGGVIFTMCKIVGHQLRNAPGSPTNEVFVAGTLILMDHVSVGGTDSKGRAQQTTASGQRLTSIDAVTGAQLAVDVGDYKTCYPGGARLACVDIYDRLDLLDPKTLAVTHSAADLIAGAKLAKPTRRIEREGETFIVVLEDGRGAQIDPAPATPTVTTLDSVQSRIDFSTSSGCATGFMLRVGETTLKFESGGTRSKLTSVPPPPAESATPSGPALSFLEPRFLATPDGLPLVLHRAAIGDNKAQLISRVEGIAKETWQVPLEGECRQAYVHDKTLVVATGNPKHRAIGIELASGRVAWTFGR